MIYMMNIARREDTARWLCSVPCMYAHKSKCQRCSVEIVLLTTENPASQEKRPICAWKYKTSQDLLSHPTVMESIKKWDRKGDNLSTTYNNCNRLKQTYIEVHEFNDTKKINWYHRRILMNNSLT